MGFVKTDRELQVARERLAPLEFYGARMLFVFWETKPEIVKRLLPPPLQAGPLPLACAYVAYFPRTNFGPAYHEGGLFLQAQFEGVPGMYCLAMPVDDDMAMAAGREIYGYPKKMGQIELHQRETALQGRISRHGQTFFEIEAKLDSASVAAPLREMIGSGLAFDSEVGAPVYLYKHFPAPDGKGFDFRPRLIRQNNVLRPETVAWAEAVVRLPVCDEDPWHEVEVVRVLASAFFVSNTTMLHGVVAAEVEPQAFMPHAWTKWDLSQLGRERPKEY